MDDFERKTPSQESADAKRLATDAKSPKDDIPDPTITQDLHEDPKGPLGEVVKATTKVEPTDADTRGNSVPAEDPTNKAHVKGLRGEALVKAGAAPPPPKTGDPAKLREDLEELQQKVLTGQAKAGDKIKILKLKDDLDQATRVAT